MLLANGAYNGKTYKKEIISVEELMAGVKETAINPYFQKEMVLFAHPKDRVSIDALNENRIRRRASASIKADYTLVDKKGNRCNLRYFETENFDDNGVPRYSPARIFVFQDETLEQGVSLLSDREKAVFMLLSPQNEDSPFFKRNDFASYRIHDPSKEAKLRDKFESDLLDIQLEIQKEAKENPDKLKRIAQGIRINGEAIVGIDFDDMSSVRVALLDFSRKYPSEFKTAFEDGTGTITRGLVLEAIRRGIITYTIQNMDTVVSFKGEQMCVFNKNMEASTGILNFIVDNDVRTWMKNLSTAVGDANYEEKLKKNK